MSAVRLYLKTGFAVFMGSCSGCTNGEVTESDVGYTTIECVCVYMCGCVGLCLCCVQIRLNVYISVLSFTRSAEVSEAHGSSCCVPSCFPASVSTWPCAGC